MNMQFLFEINYEIKTKTKKTLKVTLCIHNYINTQQRRLFHITLGNYMFIEY